MFASTISNTVETRMAQSGLLLSMGFDGIGF